MIPVPRNSTPKLDMVIFDGRAYPADRFELAPFDRFNGERRTIVRGKRSRPERDRLTGDEIGKLAVAGAATGTAIAFILDARGAAQALLSIVWL